MDSFHWCSPFLVNTVLSLIGCYVNLICVIARYRRSVRASLSILYNAFPPLVFNAQNPILHCTKSYSESTQIIYGMNVFFVTRSPVCPRNLSTLVVFSLTKPWRACPFLRTTVHPVTGFYVSNTISENTKVQKIFVLLFANSMADHIASNWVGVPCRQILSNNNQFLNNFHNF